MKQPAVRSVPVWVVVPPRALLLDIAGPLEVLRWTNTVQDRLRFDVRYVGPQATVTSSIGLQLAAIAGLPPELQEESMVILSGSVTQVLPTGGEPASAVTAEERRAEGRIVQWLRDRVRAEYQVISICSGALLAGRAGLLDGHACTTHHSSCAELQRLAPRSTVLENRLFVEDGHRLTSAGVTAGIDLMLHVVARLTDTATAIAVARYLVVYLRRSGSDPQLSPWLEGRNHLHPAVHRAQDAMTADPTKAWSISAVAGFAGASARHLSRLFREQAGMSFTDYRTRLRVALAHQLLDSTALGMEQVAERSGFASARQLRRAWARFHRESPARARASFQPQSYHQPRNR
jgi:transcriptional regulator GlxA family with amidase domain